MWYLRPKKKKLLLFPEIRVARAAAIFFSCFSGDILFSSLVSFVFFVSCFLFVCLFVCFFFLFVCLLDVLWNKKMYILIYIWLCGRVSDKIFFTGPISGNKTTFFGLMCCIFLSNRQSSMATLEAWFAGVFSIALHPILKCLSSMFTTNLFDNCNVFALFLKMLELFVVFCW